MKIVLVSVPQNAFQEIPTNQYSPTFPSTVSRINALHKRQWDISQVCRLLNVSEIEANDHFVQQTRKTFKDAKIHAEIQLLFYCELEAFKLPPRVFCSTRTTRIFNRACRIARGCNLTYSRRSKLFLHYCSRVGSKDLSSAEQCWVRFNSVTLRRLE